jgi:hypothetical protein
VHGVALRRPGSAGAVPASFQPRPDSSPRIEAGPTPAARRASAGYRCSDNNSTQPATSGPREPCLPVDAVVFATGITYDAYKAAMTQNRERLEAAEAKVTIDPRDLEWFRSLRPLRVAALVEDWCGDVIANLPVLGALARELGPTLDLRCFDKSQHPELATAYLNRGRFESLPVFAFFDADWREVGVFIERPSAVTERREEDRLAIHAEHPEFGPPDRPASELDDDVRAQLMAEIQSRRAALVGWSNRQVVLAIRDVIARAPQVGDRVPAVR